MYKVEPIDPMQTTSRMSDNGNYDFKNAMEYWYRNYKPLSLNFDLEGATEGNKEDNFYDGSHDEDDSSVFDF